MVALTKDYGDRKLDIMITDGYSGKLSFEFSNKFVAGIQKAVQSFIIRLFTAFNSRLTDKTDGTTFGSRFPELAQTDPGLVYHIMSFSISEIIEQLSQEPSSFEDERIVSAKIESIDKSKDTIDVSISITTLAGEDFKFILPVVL
jgi:hypothetical protein